MTDSNISTSYVKLTSTNEIQSLNLEMATVVSVMQMFGVKRGECEALVSEVRSHVDRAMKLDDLAERMHRQLSTVTGDRIEDDQQRLNIIASFQQEAEVLGIDTSSWKGSRVDKDAAKSIVSNIQDTAGNCLVDAHNLNRKVIESLGQMDSMMTTAMETRRGN